MMSRTMSTLVRSSTETLPRSERSSDTRGRRLSAVA